MAPLVDGELVAEGEHLEVEGSSFLEASAKGGEEGDEDGLHGKARGYPTLPAPSLPSPPRGAPRNWAFEGGFKGKFDVVIVRANVASGIPLALHASTTFRRLSSRPLPPGRQGLRAHFTTILPLLSGCSFT